MFSFKKKKKILGHALRISSSSPARLTAHSSTTMRINLFNCLQEKSLIRVQIVKKYKSNENPIQT